MTDAAESASPIVNIVGERVALGPHRRDLNPLYQRWVNDFAGLRTLAARPVPVTAEAQQAWYERVTAARVVPGGGGRGRRSLASLA